MANDDNGTNETPKPEQKQAKVEIGMDWGIGQVIIQSQVEGEETVTQIRIPADVYVQSAISIGMQMLQGIQKASKDSKIVLAHPGQVPGDLRGKKH